MKLNVEESLVKNGCILCRFTDWSVGGSKSNLFSSSPKYSILTHIPTYTHPLDFVYRRRAALPISARRLPNKLVFLQWETFPSPLRPMRNTASRNPTNQSTLTDRKLPFCKFFFLTLQYHHINLSIFCNRTILSLLGCLIVFATSRETWKIIQMQQPNDSKDEGLALRVLHCFSLVSNGRKLLSTKTASSNNNLGCLHGIRFLSATWVVMGHTWYQATFQPTYSRSILLKVN